MAAQWSVHVEVRLKPESTARFDAIAKFVRQQLEQDEQIYIPSTLEGWQSQPLLAQNVEIIRAAESTYNGNVLMVENVIFDIHVYQPSENDVLEEFTNGQRGEDDDVTAAGVHELPNRSFEGLWDALMYPDDIKPRLLNYIYATFVLSDAEVDFNIVSWNRVVLLHGPPGTGKTSLCRALAQKLSIRLSDRYTHSKLVEINSHSLFSRWFSESGKLVGRLFASITELVEDDANFVVVLIDEVESLTAARAGALSGNEPSDALRVVNALLTQLDKLKHRKNVLIMSTSNLVQAIDSAYMDRADIMQYVGLPPQDAIYWILRSCLKELMRAGIIASIELGDAKFAESFARNPALALNLDENIDRDGMRRASVLLYNLAGKCHGMSGRSLRRLPVLAHARHIGVSAASHGAASNVEVWLRAMELVVDQEATVRGASGTTLEPVASTA